MAHLSDRGDAKQRGVAFQGVDFAKQDRVVFRGRREQLVSQTRCLVEELDEATFVLHHLLENPDEFPLNGILLESLEFVGDIGDNQENLVQRAVLEDRAVVECIGPFPDDQALWHLVDGQLEWQDVFDEGVPTGS
ncbi:MAG: hypothetical protein QM784_39330 [Polyangiaceae bacterium]